MRVSLILPSICRVPQKLITVGICAMAKKAKSKQMAAVSGHPVAAASQFLSISACVILVVHWAAVPAVAAPHVSEPGVPGVWILMHCCLVPACLCRSPRGCILTKSLSERLGRATSFVMTTICITV